MAALSVPAHFDGSKIQLDEKIELSKDAKLVVTVIDESDTARDEFLKLSSDNLSRAYGDDEPEYTIEDCIRD